MNDSFPRIITLLRNERKLTQKEAADALDISQALLSHYERGARECGLDFLIRIADFYDVSCDYLLGRTSQRNGARLTVSDIPEPEDAMDNQYKGSTLPILHNKLIANSLNILFDLLQKTNCTDLTNQMALYQMVSVYKMFRLLYQANHENPASFFSVSPLCFQGYSDASLAVLEANISALSSGSAVGGMKPLKDAEPLRVSFESLNRDYPLFASSLMSLVRSAENAMNFDEKNNTSGI